MRSKLTSEVRRVFQDPEQDALSLCQSLGFKRFKEPREGIIYCAFCLNMAVYDAEEGDHYCVRCDKTLDRSNTMTSRKREQILEDHIQAQKDEQQHKQTEDAKDRWQFLLAQSRKEMGDHENEVSQIKQTRVRNDAKVDAPIGFYFNLYKGTNLHIPKNERREWHVLSHEQ